MISLLSLILANSVPLLGVLFFGWTVNAVLLTYWAESAVIGLFYIGKGIVAGFNGIRAFGLAAIPVTVIMVAFFIVHYSGFMLAHAAVLLTFLSGRDIASVVFESFPIINVGVLYNELLIGGMSLFGVCALFLSHGVSFITNFIGKKEFRNVTDASFLFSAPYKRIILMHGVIIVGGILMFTFGLPTYLIAVFIVFKIIADIQAHKVEHRAVLQ